LETVGGRKKWVNGRGRMKSVMPFDRLRASGERRESKKGKRGKREGRGVVVMPFDGLRASGKVEKWKSGKVEKLDCW
jgi:hypothetical protein